MLRETVDPGQKRESITRDGIQLDLMRRNGVDLHDIHGIIWLYLTARRAYDMNTEAWVCLLDFYEISERWSADNMWSEARADAHCSPIFAALSLLPTKKVARAIAGLNCWLQHWNVHWSMRDKARAENCNIWQSRNETLVELLCSRLVQCFITKISPSIHAPAARIMVYPLLAVSIVKFSTFLSQKLPKNSHIFKPCSLVSSELNCSTSLDARRDGSAK